VYASRESGDLSGSEVLRVPTNAIGAVTFGPCRPADGSDNVEPASATPEHATSASSAIS
jgi:hypothetical protein